MIRELSWLMLAICALIFVVVVGLLLHVIVRFRASRTAAGREPPQVYGSDAIEIAWTVIPILIVVVLFLATARTIFQIERAPLPKDALRVIVVGHQWWWEFRYPDLGIVTANELHLPVSELVERRPAILHLEAVDVVHSFWIPQLNGKTDVIPNHPNRTWVEPLRVGTYYGQCAEYCGTQHANMLVRVVVHPKQDFDAWVAAQRALPATTGTDAGRAVFFATACVNCHTIRGTPARGTFGPDLTHLMSRATLGAGVVANTRENLARWVSDPDHIKPGALMPAMNLSDGDVDAVVTYLSTLK
jgi:cytochrome c oxidase subunit 2